MDKLFFGLDFLYMDYFNFIESVDEVLVFWEKLLEEIIKKIFYDNFLCYYGLI